MHVLIADTLTILFLIKSQFTSTHIRYIGFIVNTHYSCSSLSTFDLLDRQLFDRDDGTNTMAHSRLDG